MISVVEALDILDDHLFVPEPEEVSLQQALGRITAQAFTCDRDLPPFDRVMMDGIAIDFDRYAAGQRTFALEHTAAAGSPRYTLGDPGRCVEIMTGAILPAGTDTVIRYEDLLMDGRNATILVEVKRSQNVHSRGLDRAQGDVLVPEGKMIGAAEIGVAATVGLPRLSVYQWPRVVVVSTGDELVEIDEIPLAHQIRRSNVYNMMAALQRRGLSADEQHLPDDSKVVGSAIDQMLASYDVIILIGGSSKGKFDYVPDALERAGVEKHFYKVKQRPGKPFWFGSRDDRTFVFALPGNPVSSFLCFEKYIDHWWRRSYRQPLEQPQAILDEDITFTPDLTYFLQVKVTHREGRWLATPEQGHGSGDLANLVVADAFMQLPAGRTKYRRGELYPILIYR